MQQYMQMPQKMGKGSTNLFRGHFKLPQQGLVCVLQNVVKLTQKDGERV